MRLCSQAPERDPVQWKLEASNSASGPWALLQAQRTDYSTPTTRAAKLPCFSVSSSGNYLCCSGKTEPSRGKDPPGPCGLNRPSPLLSLSPFGKEVYLSLNLFPGPPRSGAGCSLRPSPRPKNIQNHWFGNKKARHTPNTQSGSFQFSYSRWVFCTVGRKR